MRLQLCEYQGGKAIAPCGMGRNKLVPVDSRLLDLQGIVLGVIFYDTLTSTLLSTYHVALAHVL